MADGETGDISGGPQNADATAAGGAPGGGGGPPGGGPILAALARRQQGPQVSAPGPGDQANSMSMLQNAIAMMQQALPGLGTGTPAYRDTLRALQSLSRHIAQGQPTAGLQQTQIGDLLRGVARNALLAKIMQAHRQQQEQGGGDQGGPAPPMPSTPLPGA